MASICLTELSKNIETFDKNIDKLTCEPYEYRNIYYVLKYISRFC